MSAPSLPPQHASVLIIGGGPAGAYAAAVLARENIKAVVLEASKFPRYHVGESLIPSVRHYLRFIGAEEKIANHGFVRKPGSAIKFNQYKREGYTDFIALGHNNSAWNVVRSEFDHLLLNHARSVGAAVYEQTKVDSITFSKDRPISVSWTHTPPPNPPSPPASPSGDNFPGFFNGSLPTATHSGTTTFTHLIDATGRTGILSTRYLKNRHFTAFLKNIAIWGYWSNADEYASGTSRHGAPWFEALTDESGWAWFIPLHDGVTSVGVVMNQKVHNNRKEFPASPFANVSSKEGTSESTLRSRYLSYLSLAPGVVKLISDRGRLRDKSVKSSSDFSYSANSYAGPGYRIVGDAGAFIDPFFSSGIHLAMTSALSAATSICASIRRHCSEESAAQWHTKRVSTSYTRFQVVVFSAYKQMRAQSDDILSDINEDNYDRAFSFLRPVIQGASDVGARLSETELQKSLDFCVRLFDPTTPEQHERVSRRTDIAQELLDVEGDLVDPAVLENTLRVMRVDDESASSSDIERVIETRMVLNKINARRVVHAEYTIHNFSMEPLDGMVVRLEKGKLGLVKAHV